MTDKILARLKAPAEEWRFSVPLSTGGLALSSDIGGLHQLRIENLSTDEDPKLALSGNVTAIHEHHASRQVEALVKSLVGISISMGVVEINPVPTYEIPVITFPDTPGADVQLDPSLAGLVSRMRFAVPNDLDELESRRRGGTDLTNALERRLRSLRDVLSTESEASNELRSAAGLLFDAFAAPEPGKAIAFACMSMEAVLLEAKNSELILARLKEAVAYRLGKSAAERARLREQVGKVYNARCKFVHTGKVTPPSATVLADARHMAASVLRREVMDLDRGLES